MSGLNQLKLEKSKYQQSSTFSLRKKGFHFCLYLTRQTLQYTCAVYSQTYQLLFI